MSNCDSVMEEVYATRQRISARYGHDPDQYIAAIRNKTMAANDLYSPRRSLKRQYNARRRATDAKSAAAVLSFSLILGNRRKPILPRKVANVEAAVKDPDAHGVNAMLAVPLQSISPATSSTGRPVRSVTVGTVFSVE